MKSGHREKPPNPRNSSALSLFPSLPRRRHCPQALSSLPSPCRRHSLHAHAPPGSAPPRRCGAAHERRLPVGILALTEAEAGRIETARRQRRAVESRRRWLARRRSRDVAGKRSRRAPARIWPGAGGSGRLRLSSTAPFDPARREREEGGDGPHPCRRSSPLEIRRYQQGGASSAVPRHRAPLASLPNDIQRSASPAGSRAGAALARKQQHAAAAPWVTAA